MAGSWQLRRDTAKFRSRTDMFLSIARRSANSKPTFQLQDLLGTVINEPGFNRQ